MLGWVLTLIGTPLFESSDPSYSVIRRPPLPILPPPYELPAVSTNFVLGVQVMVSKLEKSCLKVPSPLPVQGSLYAQAPGVTYAVSVLVPVSFDSWYGLVRDHASKGNPGAGMDTGT